jgi:type II secretory pathway component GspD/PulD (secretin)
MFSTVMSFARGPSGWSAAAVVLTGVGVWGFGPADQPPAEIPVVRLALPAGQGPTLPATRLDDGPRGADLDRPGAVSLTFAEPLPVRDVLLLLFRGTPVSIVFEPAVTGEFVGELSELSLRQALEAVLFPSGMDYSVAGRVIRVFPRRTETRLFELSRPDVTRSWRRTVRSSTGPGDAAPVTELSSATEGDFFRELNAGIAALLSQSGRAHVDRKAGLVQVTDFADRLDHVGIYLEAISMRSARQVRLHARVLEVVLTDGVPLDWMAIAARSGIRPGTGAGIMVDDFAALLRAIASHGSVRVIAAPHFLAMNNEPAVMRIGSHHAAFGPGSAADPSASWDERRGPDDSFTLTVIPQISADGIVQMSVSPAFTAKPGPGDVPAIIETDTTMRVQAGETVVISGFVRDVVDTVPSSGVAGILGREDRRTARKELLILLTPTVVAPASAGTGAQ